MDFQKNVMILKMRVGLLELPDATLLQEVGRPRVVGGKNHTYGGTHDRTPSPSDENGMVDDGACFSFPLSSVPRNDVVLPTHLALNLKIFIRSSSTRVNGPINPNTSIR